MPTTSKPKTVPPYVFDREVRERPMPHLSDSTRAELVTKYPGITNVVAMYTVTVGTDGAVVSVDPIEPNAIVDAAVVPTLRRWRFRPQAVPIRSMLRFVLMVQ